MLWILYDLALVVIVAVTVIVHYKKGFLDVLLSFASFVAALVLAYLGSGLLAGGQGGAAIAAAGISAARPTIFMVLFIVLSIVAGLLSKTLQAIVNKIPVVGQVNKTLGGVLGLLLGLILAYVVVTVAALLIIITSNGLSWLNMDIIDKTFLFSWVYKYTVVGLL